MRTLIHGLRRLVPTPETGSEPEEDAETLCGSVCGSWSSTWVGPHGGAPMAIGAPSHTHGLSFTQKLQPLSTNSPRTYLCEAVVAASGPGQRIDGRGRAAVVVLQVKFYTQAGRLPGPPATGSSSLRVVSRCLRFSSSSKWRTFLLCSRFHRRRACPGAVL